MFVKTTRKTLMSVGVDIGSSTSHIVFSELTLEKDTTSRTEKFEITDRKILYSGPVHLTPFSDPKTVDLHALRDLILRDYEAAGIDITQVDTGAVIITGETAKKENAEDIVVLLAGEAGKFVAATAGPNFESVLAAYGSGAVNRSAETGETIMNVDVGGGSSNIAVCKDGRIVATSAINVGGRLVATDEEGVIVRLEDTGKRVAAALGVSLEVGEMLPNSARKPIADALASALVEALQGSAESDLTKILMMTEPIEFPGTIDKITFSGGVAEFLYGKEKSRFGDLGSDLAEAICEKLDELGIPLSEPDHRIRATVIGAGQSSLQVSGSTTFLSSGLKYPIRNLPAVVPYIPQLKPTADDVKTAIEAALARHDLEESVDPLILAFNGTVRPSYESLTEFARGVVAALPKSAAKGTPIFMCFSDDVGNSVGNVMRRETGIQNEICSIDEVTLSEGDFVDIGEPIIEGVVVPVVVKTLVFENGL
ncbi:MAG: ethanolamine ammonia-lyase reactivating factor EutA [Candidatus Thorarchaeota archaeon]|nr:MAG: ethanolamine ammonia-lyase reactivating factor EutA [Candidatus Thorarchaeota archaeon]